MKVKLLTETATAPVREYASAGYDLFSDDETSFMLSAGEVKGVSTGLSVEIPKGYVGLITPRSGLGTKHNIVVANLTGVIDADYRGEIKVFLWNRGDKLSKVFHPGDPIAQMVVVKLDDAPMEIVDELSDTERGSAGFGSTMGKNL